MSPIIVVSQGLAVVAAVMVVLWLVQMRTRDAGIVDVAWTWGLGFLAVFFAVRLQDGYAPRRWLVAGMTGLWSLRLGLYLLADRIVGNEEDGRYRALRKSWGPHFNRNLFFFYQFQAVAAALLAIQFLLVMLHPAERLTVWDFAAAALLFVSVTGESIADRQLARFRGDPTNRGRTCREGLWRYSRHPNYFFEWLHWLAYVVMAVGSPLWWATLFAPAVMLYLMLKVTGIPPTEAQALRSRGDDYRRYQAETSAFFPWFPKG